MNTSISSPAINITINNSNGGIINITSTPTPYRQVLDKDNVLHTFYSKESYEEYNTARFQR